MFSCIDDQWSFHLQNKKIKLQIIITNINLMLPTTINIAIIVIPTIISEYDNSVMFVYFCTPVTINNTFISTIIVFIIVYYTTPNIIFV